jgi:uncharacterized protein (DUF111 family)
MSGTEGAPSRVILLECNIDDMTGEALGYALERLLEAGALDAWFTPIYMKKNRPAALLSVLSSEERAAEMRDLILRETTTLGVRWRPMEREVAGRRSAEVDTPYGRVRIKIKIVAGGAVSAKPEHDDCAALAERHAVPLAEVVAAAQAAAAPLIERRGRKGAVGDPAAGSDPRGG